jgi:hypothetical protein
VRDMPSGDSARKWVIYAIGFVLVATLLIFIFKDFLK